MRRLLSVALVLVLAVGVIQGAALAHESKQLGDWRVVFGMTPEPVITQSYFITTWRFVDANGDPVTGLRDLSVTIVKDGKAYGPLTVNASHSTPGLYETPTVFETPGEYIFYLQGKRADGTSFSIDFHKLVQDASLFTVGG